ncbi:unnamed protein product [Brachionus calyciflorus]|uniref:G-protein coupled receptors family 1 profile domain-containing protein n=1 Tax=Brachionus calyciflorus TaxID=104777 RepID=A0A813Z0N3_9BILA|nr:unnamed protein product [Brachionus calyciflorus]
MNSSNLNEWRFSTNQKLLFYSNFTIIPLGIIFNLIQIGIFFRKKLFRLTMNIFHIIISINNIMALILTSLRFISLIEVYEFKDTSTLGCKIVPFFIRLFYQACVWLNFLVTLDRLIFIQNFVKNIHHKILILKTTLVMYAILICIDSPNFFYQMTDVNTTFNQTFHICTINQHLAIINEGITQILGIYLPLCLMFLSNLFLIKKVIESRSKFKNLKETNFAFALIISNILFTITLIPFSVYLIMVMIRIFGDFKDESMKSFLALFETITILIACYNYSFTLIIQIIFNKCFRKEFFKVINSLKIKCFRNSNQISTITETTCSLHDKRPARDHKIK